MNISTKLLIMLLSCLISATAHAENNPISDGPSGHNTFLPRSYIAPFYACNGYTQATDDVSSEGWPALYEGRVAPHLFFYSNLTELSQNEGFALSASFSPDLLLRQLNTEADSTPVRTPSYRPTLTIQTFLQWSTSDNHLLVLVPALAIGHYSNGQPTLSMYVDPEDSSSGFNLTNGDFSLNRLRGAMGLQYHILDGVIAKFTGEILFEYDWNELGGPGAISDEQKSVYGAHDIHGQLALQYLLGVEGEWTTLRVWYDFSGSAVNDRETHTVGLSTSSTYTSGLGLFTKYLGGNDHYNIRFDQQVDYLLFGFIWDGPTLQYGDGYSSPEWMLFGDESKSSQET